MLVLADGGILEEGYYSENILADDSALEEKYYSERDTFSISSAYFEGNYTDSQLATFGLELLRAEDRLEKWAQGKFPNNAIRGKLLCRIASLFINAAFWVAFHETGHGLRYKACSQGNYMLLTDLNHNGPFEKDENFFKYFVKKLFAPLARGACSPDYGALKLTPKEVLIFFAGGMNNETYFAERISDMFHDRKTMEFNESFAYFFYKISPALYAIGTKNETDPSNDPVSVTKCYKQLGINAKQSDIASTGIISLFLSGTTYSILRGMYYAFKNDEDYQAKPLEFARFIVPDTFAYITSQGISYKLSGRYRFSGEENSWQDGLSLLYGVERVFKGKAATEFSLGLQKKIRSLRDLSLAVVTTFGRGFCVETKLSLFLTSQLKLNVGYEHYSAKSLLGERHITKDITKNGDSVYLSMSFCY
jgi:hypothetical protein